MPTVKANLTFTYHPSPTDAIGFEATFEVYDTTNGGGAGETFVTTLNIAPANATYWSLNNKQSCGKRNQANQVVSKGADDYDAEGITASWTERISDTQAGALKYLLRGRFDAPLGMIAVTADCTQLTDPANTASLDPTNTTSVTVMIPTSH